jgi:WD40 repeat protein
MLPPLQGHDDYIFFVAFSPDGSKIVSGSADNTIRIWDASTGVEMLPPLQGHDQVINSVAFSPDGSKIISRDYDKTIRVWDASTGVEFLPSWPKADDDILKSAPDCRIISFDKGWFTDSNTGRCLGRLPVDNSYYGWRTHGSGYVGWTRERTPVILQFP